MATCLWDYLAIRGVADRITADYAQYTAFLSSEVFVRDPSAPVATVAAVASLSCAPTEPLFMPCDAAFYNWLHEVGNPASGNAMGGDWSKLALHFQRMKMCPSRDQLFHLSHVLVQSGEAHPSSVNTASSASDAATTTMTTSSTSGTKGGGGETGQNRFEVQQHPIVSKIYSCMFNVHPPEFPAPMCVPMSRPAIALLKDPSLQYTFVEKSDGIRCVTVVETFPRVPCWELSTPILTPNITGAAGGGGGGGAVAPMQVHMGTTVLPLSDVATLEFHRHQMIHQGALVYGPIRLNGFSNCPLEVASGPDGQNPDPTVNIFLQVDAEFQQWSACRQRPDGTMGTPHALRRSIQSQQFMFFTDRTMSTVGMLLPQRSVHPYTTTSSSPSSSSEDGNQASVREQCLAAATSYFPRLDSAVLDGELLETLFATADGGSLPIAPRLRLAFFDVLGATLKLSMRAPWYTVAAPVTSAPRINEGAAVRTTTADEEHPLKIKLFHRSLSYRYHLLKWIFENSTATSLSCRFPSTQTSPAVVHPRFELFCKEMFPIQALPSVLARLSVLPATAEGSGGHRKYLFDQLTGNDGFIFSPERFDLYAGSHEDQFKWKWPEMLTVDFCVYKLPSWMVSSHTHAVSPAGAIKAANDVPAIESSSSSSTSASTPARPPAAGELVTLSLLFKKKGTKNRSVPEQDICQHVELGKFTVLNPHGFPIPPHPKSSSGPTSTTKTDARGHVTHEPMKDLAKTNASFDLAMKGLGGSSAHGVSSVGALTATAGTGETKTDFIPGSIFECAFDAVTGKWNLLKPRHDKVEANSIITGCSVLENIAENLTVETLLSELCGIVVPAGGIFGSDAAGGSATAAATAAAAAQVPEVFFSIRAVQAGGLIRVKLQWQVSVHVDPMERPNYYAEQLRNRQQPPGPVAAAGGAGRGGVGGGRGGTERGRGGRGFDGRGGRGGRGGGGRGEPQAPEPFIRTFAFKQVNHRDASDCFGLSEPCPRLDSSSELVSKLLLQVANDGGCVGWSDTLVKAQYHGGLGRWGIIDVLKGSKKQTFAHFCLNHLQHLVHCNALGASVNIPSAIDPKLCRMEALTLATPAAAAEDVGDDDDEEGGSTATKEAIPSQHYKERTALLSNRARERSTLTKLHNLIKAAMVKYACDTVRRTKVTTMKTFNGDTLEIEEVFEDPAARTTTAAAAATVKSTVPDPFLLDLCCGRGGDLLKYQACSVGKLLMADACLEAVGQAAGRYSVTVGLSVNTTADPTSSRRGIPAHFIYADCFDRQTLSLLSQAAGMLLHSSNAPKGEQKKDEHGAPIAPGAAPVPTAAVTPQTRCCDVVSCQFSMHYSCSRLERLEAFLSNVATMLKPGGLFIGTTVDSDEVQTRFEESGLKFGNSLYGVDLLPAAATAAANTTAEGATRTLLPFGTPYSMTFEEAVASEVEYLPVWSVVQDAAKRHGLELVETANLIAFASGAMMMKQYVTYLKQQGQSLAAAVHQREQLLQANKKRSREDGGGDCSASGRDDDVDLRWMYSQETGCIDTELMTDDEREASSLYRMFVFRRV